LDRAVDYVIASAQQIVVGKLSKASHWRDQINAIATGFFDWVEAYPEQGSILMFLYFSATFSEKRSQFTTRMAAMGFNRTLGILSSVKAKKGWNRSQLETLSHAIWAVIDGMMIYHLTARH